MIKKMFALVALLAATQFVSAQFNVTYISDLSYNQDLNDIWGYVAPDGTEYALVGAANGTSIVSLADPANPVEVGYVPGDNTIWRDIKVWDHYAYVVTDDNGENSFGVNDGLTVIDLSDLPNSVSSIQMTDFGALGTLNSCHNIWIDEFGYAYLAGCNLNSGGMIYLDCDANPAMPEIIGPGPPVYSHDVYTRNNLMYSSEINDGVFSVYDVSDKGNTVLLGDRETDFSFTHNSWLNDAGDVLFTTDELEGAPIGSYDVSDPSDIKLLDLFKPLETLGDGVIPHNVHVLDDWIIISYYTDGCIIVDGSNPENLVEVGNFDTYFPSNIGFNGAWGAYPYFPSGLIVVSDIDNGLYVLEPNYVRACWLEGKVTDADNGMALNAVDVSINSTELNQGMSNATGEYATGLATAGTYEVTYTKAGYIPKTITDVVLENGVLTIRDVELSRLPTYEVTGKVVDEENGSAIENARVLLESDDFSFEVTTDANGVYTFPEVNDGTYNLVALKWGYHFDDMNITVDGQNYSATDLEIERGYRDEFLYDYNWVVTGNAATGIWERGDPIGTTSQGTVYNPGADVGADIGGLCYVTGNGGQDAGTDDVDDGNTILTSPSMDLTSYIDPEISFWIWFANGGGNGTPNDELVVRLNNGNSSVDILTLDENTDGWDGPFTYMVEADFITNSMTIEFETSDDSNSGHLVEAAVDFFKVENNGFVSSNRNLMENYMISAMPNPFSERVIIRYDLPEAVNNGQLLIYNSLGQLVTTKNLSGNTGIVQIDELSAKGLYFAQVEADGQKGEVLKIMKAE